ncbi:MAG: hypothetical protein LBH89_02750 [Lactococcus lactis]|jgi:hypothetical protein|nr:hypothetical protein [Lactococcus lactis]
MAAMKSLAEEMVLRFEELTEDAKEYAQEEYAEEIAEAVRKFGAVNLRFDGFGNPANF